MIGALVERATATAAPVWAIYVRFAVALVFLPEGIQKLLFPEILGSGRFARIGIPAPELLGPFVGVVELVCGALILVGLATRAAAVPLIVTMLVAIVGTKIPILLGRDWWIFHVADFSRYGFWSFLHETRTDWAMLMGSLFLLAVGAGPWFTAGWVFLVAKSASAATAALGFAGYALHALGQPARYLVPVALAVVALLTATVLGGLRRSNMANIAIVAVTVASLAFFVLAGIPRIETDNLWPLFAADGRDVGPAALLEATALMFVAYTGYARIATLGEEVCEPERTIPRAIVLAAVIVMLLYGAVAVVGIGAAGSDGLRAATEERAAPLAIVAQRFAVPGASAVLAVGALTAMLGVLLNLLLGLSRVALAMGRRGDLPSAFAALNERGTTPYRAVLAIGALIASIVTLGSVRTTWSFSAFSVLIYYALTNLAALRMPASQRSYPRAVAAVGLAACLGLAFWVDREVWLAGLALIAMGLGWHGVARRRAAAGSGER